MDPPGFSDEELDIRVVTDEYKISNRSQEILQSVWAEFDARMYTKSTSKLEFFDKNRPMAMELATKEFEDERAKAQAELVSINESFGFYAYVTDLIYC